MAGLTKLLEPADEIDALGQAQPARVKLRELLAIAGLVVLADLTIYRGYGFAGMAAFFTAAAVSPG